MNSKIEHTNWINMISSGRRRGRNLFHIGAVPRGVLLRSEKPHGVLMRIHDGDGSHVSLHATLYIIVWVRMLLY